MKAAAAPTAMPAFVPGVRVILLETVVAIEEALVEEFVVEVGVALLDGDEVVESCDVDGVEVPMRVRIIVAGFEVFDLDVVGDDVAENDFDGDDVVEDDVVGVVSLKATRADCREKVVPSQQSPLSNATLSS